MSETTETVGYNPFDPGFVLDPYPSYKTMRETDPVHQTVVGFWVLFAYEDCVRFLRDPSLSVEDRNATPGPLDQLIRDVMGDENAERGTRAMLNRDPPDHTRLRKLVSKAFTPRRIEELRPRIEQLVDEHLDRAARAADESNEPTELIGALAFPLPFVVISEMLGVPDTDTVQLREWSELL